MRLPVFLLSMSVLLTACEPEGVDGQQALFRHVEKNRVGSDSDQWIEMLNMAGEWERVGLIFGYVGNYDECLKAIEGLKKVNYDRDYRCVPAN